MFAYGCHSKRDEIVPSKRANEKKSNDLMHTPRQMGEPRKKTKSKRNTPRAGSLSSVVYSSEKKTACACDDRVTQNVKTKPREDGAQLFPKWPKNSENVQHPIGIGG